MAAAAVVIPGSPFYLVNLVYGNHEYYEGHSARYWIKLLDGPTGEERQKAIVALGAIGNEAGEAVPALAKRMREDSDPETRYKAALALSKMCPAARAAVSELGEALEDDEPFVRVNAAMTLYRLGDESRPAISALIKAVEDETNRTKSPPVFHFTIQELSALALGRATAGTSEGVPVLMSALNTATTVRMRIAAARALGDIGAEARPAIPQLRALRKDKDGDLREAVETALEKIE
jgi:HEAT repeat protein